jgi:hypothetical protein
MPPKRGHLWRGERAEEESAVESQDLASSFRWNDKQKDEQPQRRWIPALAGMTSRRQARAAPDEQEGAS